MSSEISINGDRPTGACASVARIGGTRLVASIVIALCCIWPTAAETLDPAAINIEGRWVAGGGKLTLDMSRCKEGWCGVEVTGATCGKTALRIAVPTPEERIHHSMHFLGRLELAAEALPYVVEASIVQQQPAMQLRLVGHTGDKFELWRRTFPLTMMLSRSGDAQCRLTAEKTS
jgi:hypothetical protein